MLALLQAIAEEMRMWYIIGGFLLIVLGVVVGKFIYDFLDGLFRELL